MAKDRSQAEKLVNTMWGADMGKPGVVPEASRVAVRETVLHKVSMDLMQSRVSIDRFTGGARESHLFSEQPALGGDGSTVRLEMRLINPQDPEIGLLLLLLKDLWTGDLALGGESSVGRGRVKGRSAGLALRRQASSEWQVEEWQLEAGPRNVALSKGDRNALEDFVVRLNAKLNNQGG